MYNTVLSQRSGRKPAAPQRASNSYATGVSGPQMVQMQQLEALERR